jgi:hypothetical protein
MRSGCGASRQVSGSAETGAELDGAPIAAMYAQDYDETLPRWWTPKGGPNNGPRDWATDTFPYIKNEQVYRCPSS